MDGALVVRLQVRPRYLDAVLVRVLVLYSY
jgi:hypothetical protein